MREFLILLYFLINLVIIIYYYRKPLGVFQAPFLGSITCLIVLFPQLISIYFAGYYSNDLLDNLLFVVLTCNIAFYLGYSLALRSSMPKKIRDIDLNKGKFLFLALGLIGLFASISMRGVWMNELEGSDRSNFIVLVNLVYYMEIVFLFSLTYFIKNKFSNKLILVFAILAALLMLEGVFLLGRRNLALRLILSITFFISLAYPKLSNLSRRLVLFTFLSGFIVNASISSIRSNLSGSVDSEISFLDNLTSSFKQKDFSLGMDLGNAALGIDYIYRNDYYDYGTTVWNKFIYNFVPRFIVGQETKDFFMFETKYETYMRSLTHSVTTRTGYFDAFGSFSYLGFIMFFLVGYLIGKFWMWSFFSSMYRIIYMFLFSQIPNIFTHGIQYVLMRIEFIFLFFIPIFIFYIFKRRRKAIN
jgi:hypothetical protein